VAVLPLAFRWSPRPSFTGRAAHVELDLAYALALVLVYYLYRTELRTLGKARSMVLAFLIVFLAAITYQLHRYYIDHASLTPAISNLDWQIKVHEGVMHLAPSFAPHSYRFLPNCLVRWLQLAGFGYENARDAYRLFAGLVLFYALYRYARLFANYAGAVIAMLLVALIYPISFEYYAGQLTDPLSQLSFILALTFVETADFALFSSTLLIGSLAKETVLAMAAYYVLFRRAERHYGLKASLLACAVVIDYFGVRWLVLGRSAHYRYDQVSGITQADVWINWHNGRWLPVVLLSVGSLLPFLFANWKDTPSALKQQVFFLLPTLFLSSLFFSWLFEARNFMPLVFVLAVVTGRYMSKILLQEEKASASPQSPASQPHRQV
jgi:hypothetical protein